MSEKKNKGKPDGAPVMPKRDNKKVLRFLWGYMKRRWWLFLIAVILTLTGTAASLLATNLQAPMIDNFIHPTDAAITVAERTEGLVSSLILIGVLLISQAVISYLTNRTLITASNATINDLRKDLFSHLQTLPISYYDGTTRGEIMSRVTNDCDTVNEFFGNSLISLFSCILSLVGIIASMFLKNVVLTLVNLVAIPLLMFVVSGIMKRASAYFRKRQASLGALNGFVEETVTCQKVVKVFLHEEAATEKFDELNEVLRKDNRRALMLGGMMMPVSRNLNNIVYACIATFGGLLAVGGTLSVGGLVVFLQLSSQFGRPINEIAGQFNSVSSALAGAERIQKIMEAVPEDNDGEFEYVNENGEFFWKSADAVIPVKGDVRFENVDFSYTPDKQVLYDLSFYAKPNQKVAFVGSTGAGKTTLINLLARFYDIQNGKILIDGIDSTHIRRKSVREAMAVVLQDTHLFTGTVKDNIRYGRLDATDEEVESVAKLTHAHSFIRRLPQGYDTIIDGDGDNLSQGQRQLLNITRAALAHSPVLVLDEATSSVDTRTEQLIDKGLDTLMSSRTTYIIAHRLSTIRNSNAIMVMDFGRIIERGTHEQLVAMGGRYYELYMGIVELA